MIKLKLQIGILLFMLFFVFPQTKGYAFLPKTDGLKSGSKLSNFFLNLKSNTEKAMEWVVNSKASQLIGDGIKETKNGISFAKESYANAMNFYGQTVETVDKVKSSDEYKTAVISKQIINESSELKKLEEEKLTKLEDLQQEMELLQSQNTSKINNINNNIDVLETSTVDEVSINNINQQIASLQQQTQEQLQELEQQYNQIEAEYDSKIEEKKNNISELNKKLADIANSKLVSENAGESIKDTQKSMFTLQGEETDIKNRREKRDNRKKALSDTIDETVYKAASGLFSITSAKEDLETKKGIANTMPGESENSGVAAEVVIKQTEMLQQYLEYIIADLKLQTAEELASINQISFEVSEMDDSFNFCDYTIKKSENKTSFLEQAKNTYQNVSQTTSSIKDSASQTISSVKEKKEDVKGKYEETKDLINQANQVIEGVKDTAENKTEEDVSAITGMI